MNEWYSHQDSCIAFKMSAVFHQAVLEGDTTKVKFILKYGQGIRVNKPNKYGLTALQQACIDGNLSLANFLLECGADLKIVDSSGRSALHLASEQGHLDIVSLLVNSACADVNARNSSGQKAVDVAENEQVRALLSQAMLSESFKQKCSVAPGWDQDSYGFKNVPGWRYSISSTSTDSGVSEDSTFSHDSGADSRYSNRYYKTASYNNQDQSSDYYVTNSNRDQRAEREELVYARRVETVPPHATVTKSHSFTGTRHEYSLKLENAALGVEDTAYGSPAQYRRQQKNRRDPTRRKTVTFGENESYFISPREGQRYPATYSLTRPPISSSNRHPLPESWGTSSTPHEKSNSTWFSEQREATGATKDKDKRSSNAGKHESGSRKEGKFKKHILPGFLEKYVH